MTVLFGVGVGGSGDGALDRVRDGVDAIAAIAPILGRSRSYANPAWGGATRAPFVNACVVVQTSCSSSSLLQALHSLERRAGRVRGQKNIARTLDLDILWSSALPAASTSTASPVVPHPRLLQRAFAVIPLVEALDDAGVVVSLALRGAHARLGLAVPMRALR